MVWTNSQKSERMIAGDRVAPEQRDRGVFSGLLHGTLTGGSMNKSKKQASSTITVDLDIVDKKTMRELSELLGLSREKIAEEVLGLWLQEQRAAMIEGEDWFTNTLRKGWGISLQPLA